MLSVGVSCEEEMIKHNLLNAYAFKYAPKAWIQYINAFSQYSLIEIMRSCEQFTVHFLKDTMNNIDTLRMRTSSQRFLDAMVVRVSPVRPFGKILGLHRPTHIPVYRRWSLTEGIWMFRPNPQFRLNLTFQKVYFSTSNCPLGNSTIQSEDSDYINLDENDENQSLETVRFVYCGHQSTYFNYPPFGIVNIIISTVTGIYFDISIAYVAIDAGIIMNKNFPRQSSPNSPVPQWHIIFPKVQMSLLYYIIRVEKYKIRVQVFGSNLTIVHDGPGIKSNLLKMSDSKM